MMDFSQLQLLVEQISEEIVLIEPSDDRALSDLHKALRELGSGAEALGQESILGEAKKAARILEQLIFDASEDAEAELQEVGEIVSGLQSKLRDLRAPEAVSDPTPPEAQDEPAEEPVEQEIFSQELAEVEVLDPEEVIELASEGAEALNNLAESEEIDPGDLIDLHHDSVADISFSSPALESEEEPEAPEASPVNTEFLPENVDLEIFTEFLSRQPGVMDEFEECVLSLDHGHDEAMVDKLKRIVHTLKGESGLLGLDEVQKICHATESFLEESLDSPQLVDTLLEIKDWLSRTFTAYAGKGILPGPADVLIELLFETTWVQPTESEEVEPDDYDEVEPEEEPGLASAGSASGAIWLNESDGELLNDFIIEASEHLENVETQMLTLETVPDDEAALSTVFRAFHTIKGVAGYLALDQIGQLSHDTENLLDRARKGDLVLKGRAIDALFDAVDMMKQLVANVRDAMTNATPLAYEPGLASVVEMINEVMGIKPKEPVRQTRIDQPARAETPTESKPPVEQKATPRQATPQASPQARPIEAQFVQVRESIKVDADRLDRLIDTIGELVITESMVSQMMRDKYTDSLMMSNLSQLDKITRQLQEMSTSLRMVPVRASFQKMARLVRDLAKKSGKRIDFVMNGEDTELDKSVVDKIGDPLVHMIRNAVDHGIESVEERVKAGKPEVGRIELRAFHKGGSIYIEVVDDGKGLAREKIMAKAVENGLIADGSTLSEKEIYNLIFKSGFSTAGVVTDVSGRGIGMDVVRRNIESLRGRIDLQSTPGAGSVFSIRLPLTLAIIDGMMVGVGEERYIVPTLSIVRSLRPEAKNFSPVQGRGEMYSLDGMMIPVFYLNRLFGIESSKDDIEESLLVVIENDGLYTGLVVDELFGQHQIVIKTLGKLLQGIPGISGSTIMTDGRVALILDIAGLVKLANRERLGTA